MWTNECGIKEWNELNECEIKEYGTKECGINFWETTFNLSS